MITELLGCPAPSIYMFGNEGIWLVCPLVDSTCSSWPLHVSAAEKDTGILAAFIPNQPGTAASETIDVTGWPHGTFPTRFIFAG